VKLTDFPVNRPVATLMLLVALVVLGIVSAFQLPLGFWPTVERPEIQVTIPFPGSHPLEGLREIAEPIEEELAAIPDIEGIESDVRSGEVDVQASFAPRADVDLKKMEVREAVERARARLPDDIGFIRIEGHGHGIERSGAILQGRISADRNLSESWELLDRRIRRPLERIKGIARVDLYGVEPQEVRVDLDLDALRSHGFQPGDIITAINRENLDLDLGVVRGDLLSYNVRSLARFRDVEVLGNLRLGDAGVRLRDVARVELREPRLPYGRHLHRRFAIGIDVYAEPTASVVDLHDRIMVTVEEIQQDPELAGIRLLVWESAGEQIRVALRGLRDAGIFGGILAITVLYLFLRRWKTTLVIAAAIPFSILVTCAGMFLLGTELNLISMVGLMMGVGMMVDNAVVVIENIHRLEQGGMPAPVAAKRGAGEVALAVVAATATTLIVWAWVLFEEPNEMKAQVGGAALPICLAVTCSLIISLTFIPLAASRFKPHKGVRPGFLSTRVVPAYRRLLGWTFRHRFVTLVGLLLLAGTAAIPITLIEKAPEPKTVNRFAAIFYEIHDPSTKEVLEGYVNQVEAWVESRRDELGYESMYSWFSERGPDVMTWVYLPKDELTEEALKALQTKLKVDLPTIAGVTLTIGDRDWWRHGRRGGKRLASVALHGHDPEHLETVARRVEDRLRGLPDVVEVLGPSIRGTKEVRLVVDPAKAHAFGVTPREVAQAVGFAFQGRRLRRFEGPNGEIELMVGIPEEAQPGLVTLEDLPLPVEHGGTVPLSSVAELELTRTPPRIRREDRMTTAWVSVEFDEEKVPNTEAAKARIEASMESFELPDGYAWSWGRWGRDRDDALDTMLRGVLLSLLVVVLLMAALFESFTQPLAIIITLPMAFFGAFWALWLLDFVLDPVAFFGVILLIGIVVNNGIVMVNHVNALRRHGRERVEALIEGCGDRLRPVLMTAITTIFGILPLGFSAFTVRGAPMGSLSTVIAGGLATSTLFTLIGLPVWYTMIEEIGSMVTRLLPRWKNRPPKTETSGLMTD